MREEKRTQGKEKKQNSRRKAKRIEEGLRFRCPSIHRHSDQTERKQKGTRREDRQRERQEEREKKDKTRKEKSRETDDEKKKRHDRESDTESRRNRTGTRTGQTTGPSVRHHYIRLRKSEKKKGKGT